MLAGSVPAGMASSAWFGSYAAGQPSHASAPSVAASDTSSVLGMQQTGNNSSGQLDWIVQFNPAAASGIASAAGAARLLPPGGGEFQVLEGLGAVGEVLAVPTASRPPRQPQPCSPIAKLPGSKPRAAADRRGGPQRRRVLAAMGAGQHGSYPRQAPGDGKAPVRGEGRPEAALVLASTYGYCQLKLLDRV